MPIEPITSLAVSINAGPGAYALLLGSGVSRASNVPTGWDVVSDLARKVALAQTGSEPVDPIAWYRDNVDSDPSYSSLLETVGSSPAARRDLLEKYFEPSAEDREVGTKLPTRAHKAIARLVASGFVQVIVTTNFDRLIELALDEVGVSPVVITNAASAAGAPSLARTKCTIIKVHGDYLEPDIKNTISELSEYEEEMNKVLDRVFDDYGILVCGWSADWDEALRQAILRSPSRRYGMHWARISPPSALAQRLIEHRGGIEIEITDSDSFFEALESKVMALESSGVGPLTTDVAMSELKRYVPDPVHRIRLRDLVIGEVRAMRLRVGDADRSVRPTSPVLLQRMEEVERACSISSALLSSLTFYAETAEHRLLIRDAIKAMAVVDPLAGGYSAWGDLEMYPALLGMYAIGLAAVAKEDIRVLVEEMTPLTVELRAGRTTIFTAMNPHAVLDRDACNASVNPTAKLKTAESDYLHSRLKDVVADLFSSDDEFDVSFDAWEFIFSILCSLPLAAGTSSFHGRSAWRGSGAKTRVATLAKYRGQILSGPMTIWSDADLDEVVRIYEERATMTMLLR